MPDPIPPQVDRARANKWRGVCTCGKNVPARAGFAVRINGQWFVRCEPCFGQAPSTQDHASAEDACCGDYAYEEACACACGL